MKLSMRLAVVAAAICISGCDLSACREVANQELTVSLLAVNLEGVHETYGTQYVTWPERCRRIGAWVGTNLPDIVALQEVHGYKHDVFGGSLLSRYLMPFTLLDAVQDNRPNSPYRVAYLSVNSLQVGLDWLWAGRAILYNADRLVNVTRPANTTPAAFDNNSTTIHLRGSLPCTQVAPAYASMCNLIDDDGAWVSPYVSESGRLELGPAFARFQLKFNGQFIDVYNVHALKYGDFFVRYGAALDLLLVSMEQRFGQTRVYPPFVLGDFNAACDTLGSYFGGLQNFKIAACAGRDVMGIVVGDNTQHPAEFVPSPTCASHPCGTTLPTVVQDPSTNALCGSHTELWSDHCGLLATISPK